MYLQRSIKSLQQTLQQDLEEMGSKRDRKGPSQHATDHQPFTVCLGLLLKSAEVSLLLKPIPQPEGSGSPLGSDLSPSESRGTLEPQANGVEKGSEGDGPGSEGGATKGAYTVDQLLCGDGSEGGSTQVLVPLIPCSSSTTHLDSNHEASLEERPSTKNSERWSSDDGGEVFVDGRAGGDVSAGLDFKAQTSDTLSNDLPSSKDPAAASKMPQSISRYSLHHTRAVHKPCDRFPCYFVFSTCPADSFASFGNKLHLLSELWNVTVF